MAFLLAGFGLAIPPACAQSRPSAEPRHVLLLESFGRDVAPWNVITPAFKSELGREIPGAVDFHETALETARDNAPEAEVAFAEYLRALYARRAPDLVVPVGGAAAQFWWRHRTRLFPQTPVVIAGIEHRLLQMLPLGSNDTAVAVQFDFRSGPETLLHVLPGVTNIGVVVGNSRLERFWVAECQQSWSALSNRARITWFNHLPFSEICRCASQMPPNSALAYGMFFIDGAGVPHEQMRALDQLCAVASVPVFGLFEEQLGHGIVGGQLFSSETIGREAARSAARILRGESAAGLAPQVLNPSKPTFDWRQLQRWGISERALPPGSIVRFRQPSAWERYRWFILGALGIIGLQALTIIALLAQRARRRRAELAAQRHRNELMHIGRVHVLGQLSCALAHEINQPLGAILSNAEAAELLLQKGAASSGELAEILADIRKDDQRASDVIQRMRSLLRRQALELQPLSAEELIRECLVLTRPNAVERKVAVTSDVRPDTPQVRGDRVHLEQVLLNLILNSMDAMRDCPVERRSLHVRAGRGPANAVDFAVEDAGPGIASGQLDRVFDLFHTTKPDGLGVGLSISRTIIEAHQGRIRAENNPRGGAIFRFTLPAADGADAAGITEAGPARSVAWR